MAGVPLKSHSLTLVFRERFLYSSSELLRFFGMMCGDAGLACRRRRCILLRNLRFPIIEHRPSDSVAIEIIADLAASRATVLDLSSDLLHLGDDVPSLQRSEVSATFFVRTFLIRVVPVRVLPGCVACSL